MVLDHPSHMVDAKDKVSPKVKEDLLSWDLNNKCEQDKFLYFKNNNEEDMYMLFWDDFKILCASFGEESTNLDMQSLLNK